jgi:hypothetical protein
MPFKGYGTRVTPAFSMREKLFFLFGQIVFSCHELSNKNQVTSSKTCAKGICVSDKQRISMLKAFASNYTKNIFL